MELDEGETGLAARSNYDQHHWGISLADHAAGGAISCDLPRDLEMVAQIGAADWPGFHQTREVGSVFPARLEQLSKEWKDKMQKTFEGRNRAEAIQRIFTEGVKDFAKENGCPMGQALSELIQANPDLWAEYCADVVPVRGTQLKGDGSVRLAAEMNAYAKENRCSLSVALSEVAKANPDLLQEYREEIATIV